MKAMTRDEIADKIAYIPQKTYIFSGTIRENIVYGCSRKNIAEIEIAKAAHIANLSDEITSSLGGLSGKVLENGNNLSGGQKQRLGKQFLRKYHLL